MKLKSEYITYSIDENVMLVGTGPNSFKGVVKANQTAAYILSCLAEEISYESLIQKMQDKYDVDKSTVAADVDKILNSLRSIHALDE